MISLLHRIPADQKQTHQQLSWFVLGRRLFLAEFCGSLVWAVWVLCCRPTAHKQRLRPAAAILVQNLRYSNMSESIRSSSRAFLKPLCAFFWIYVNVLLIGFVVYQRDRLDFLLSARLLESTIVFLFGSERRYFTGRRKEWRRDVGSLSLSLCVPASLSSASWY